MMIFTTILLLLKSLDDKSLKSVKISASLEGYTEWLLRNNRLEKREFSWKYLKASK